MLPKGLLAWILAIVVLAAPAVCVVVANGGREEFTYDAGPGMDASIAPAPDAGSPAVREPEVVVPALERAEPAREAVLAPAIHVPDVDEDPSACIIESTPDPDDDDNRALTTGEPVPLVIVA